VQVVRAGYPDDTAWDLNSDHYDPKSTPARPIWYQVDVKLKCKFPRLITLEEIKSHPALKTMLITRKGNRLSITPVTTAEWNIINKLASC
jgi:predicted RNA-binding protein with PUA-like domain